jgi:ketosteroid isomerase-like protein
VDAGNKLDTATTVALVAPNAVIHMLYDATDPLTREPVGHEEEFNAEEMEKRIAHSQKMFSEQHGTIDHIFDVGEDMVLTIGTFTSIHKSGKKVKTQSVSLDRIADGKVVESWYLGDRLGYWQQLGLVPPTSELMKKLAEM